MMGANLSDGQRHEYPSPWFEMLSKLRPVPAATGGLLFEDSLAASLAQRLYLGGSVLVVSLGDTGVADEQRALFQRASVSSPLIARRVWPMAKSAIRSSCWAGFSGIKTLLRYFVAI